MAEPTLTPTSVFSATPLVSPTPPPTLTPTRDMPCLRANLEYLLIPNNSRFPVEKTFTQMFRLKNTGTCTWNHSYELRFVQGDLLNAGAAIPITNTEIPTWGYANVEVKMRAPGKPGHYKGYWMIKSDTGKLFGVGPSGSSWFWFEIDVFDPD
jgi:hypothetical protein